MAHSILDISQPGKSGVWLDFYAYAANLLAKGNLPWLDQAQFVSFLATAQSLLRSDVISLPLESLAEALLDDDLRAAMKAKSRPGFPLRTLLQDAKLRDTVTGLLVPLRASHPGLPLSLLLPSPRRWLAGAYQSAHGEALDPEVAGDNDEIDSAAVYLADFLRCFADSNIDALLLLENPGEAPSGAEQWACYDPVINIAKHYRWQVGVLDPAPAAPLSAGSGIDFCIAPALAAGTPGGLMLDPAFWQGAAAPSLEPGQFRYAAIPAGATPETVLQQLAQLR
ncbi:MAG: hypothetical protein HY847_01085 [Betaproteobacteria bacterium]|nr:hypothetical protein [Betaproteobacteria bacterium]